ncbi:hypothetical protein [Streptomyces sp. C36]|uniref:hypothetical protein n=1 Tax=Streptomyces sp. C36 TaxID=3237122 RepID=UPI0034C6D36E
MSVMLMLRDAHSPLRAFLESELPHTGRLREAYRAALPAGMAVVTPQAPLGEPPKWSVLATAIDCRLRLALTSGEQPLRGIEDGIAAASKALSTAPDIAAAVAGSGRDLLALLKSLAGQHHPEDRNRPLQRDPETEDRLARACYGAALFKGVGHCADPTVSRLLRHVAHPHLTLDELLAGVEDYEARDTSELTAVAATALAPLLQTTTPQQITLAPAFPAGGGHDGLEGDWLADGLLIDVHATIRPEQLPLSDIHHLATCLLLDRDDELGITGVGWYSARAGALIHFEAAEFLRLLGARHTLHNLRRHLTQLWNRPTPAPRPLPQPPTHPPASAKAEPATLPLPRPRRLQITHGERHYELTLTPDPAGTCQASAIVLSPGGEILSHFTTTVEITDLEPLGRLIHLASQEAPQHTPSPATRKSAPPRNGQSWSNEELDQLRSSSAQGVEPDVIARLLGRSERSIAFKLHQLRLAPFPTDHVKPPAAPAPASPPAYTVEEVRRTHPRAYERWTPEEAARLRQRHDQGASIGELAQEFGRNEGAIISRLGLRPPTS